MLFRLNRCSIAIVIVIGVYKCRHLTCCHQWLKKKAVRIPISIVRFRFELEFWRSQIYNVTYERTHARKPRFANLLSLSLSLLRSFLLMSAHMCHSTFKQQPIHWLNTYLFLNLYLSSALLAPPPRSPTYVRHVYNTHYCRKPKLIRCYYK